MVEHPAVGNAARTKVRNIQNGRVVVFSALRDQECSYTMQNQTCATDTEVADAGEETSALPFSAREELSPSLESLLATSSR